MRGGLLFAMLVPIDAEGKRRYIAGQKDEQLWRSIDRRTRQEGQAEYF